MTGPLLARTGPIKPWCAKWYWACTNDRYRTDWDDCTAPVLARYTNVYWV